MSVEKNCFKKAKKNNRKQKVSNDFIGFEPDFRLIVIETMKYSDNSFYFESN